MCKSHTLELHHQQFVIAKSYFLGFHLRAWIKKKKKFPTIQAPSDSWNPLDSEFRV
jgi:hypothetical protein